MDLPPVRSVAWQTGSSLRIPRVADRRGEAINPEEFMGLAVNSDATNSTYCALSTWPRISPPGLADV
jgi:hypothetical protein